MKFDLITYKKKEMKNNENELKTHPLGRNKQIWSISTTTLSQTLHTPITTTHVESIGKEFNYLTKLQHKYSIQLKSKATRIYKIIM